jgi:hypothetical protein
MIRNRRMNCVLICDSQISWKKGTARTLDFRGYSGHGRQKGHLREGRQKGHFYED